MVNTWTSTLANNHKYPYKIGLKRQSSLEAYNFYIYRELVRYMQRRKWDSPDNMSRELTDWHQKNSDKMNLTKMQIKVLFPSGKPFVT